ncbi:uncharacterized protein LODBEIA_P10140 [Lodderomyces beijingensis]|uniref:DH domain-containing protein n=1 Tax=Lodderomyces beijingensis TaxID=1775926 RepID=A0ABP0ZF48_9ASCO
MSTPEIAEPNGETSLNGGLGAASTASTVEANLATTINTAQNSTKNMSASPAEPINKKAAYKPTTITSLDCKILQYEYGIYKLEHFLKGLKKLESSLSSTSELPLMQYIVLLTGNTFAINEKGFDPKLSSFSNFKPIPLGTFNISAATSHIPYDIPDLSVSPLDKLPSSQSANLCLRQLESLTQTCLEGYQKKLATAKTEMRRILINYDEPSYYLHIREMLARDIFHQDMDLTLNDLTFPHPESKELLENSDYEEAALVDMDIKELFAIYSQCTTSLKHISQTIEHMKKAKLEDAYAIHKTFLLTQRLNELYTIIRRFGRKIYLSNHQHLVDSRFLHIHGNAAFFRAQVMKNMDDYFNSMKKNGTLIANVTRLIRQDSKFEINHKNMLNHMNFASQGLKICEKSLQVLHDLGSSWIIGELKFRRAYQLPRQLLIEIYQGLPEYKEKMQQQRLKEQQQQQLKESQLKEQQQKEQQRKEQGEKEQGEKEHQQHEDQEESNEQQQNKHGQVSKEQSPGENNNTTLPTSNGKAPNAVSKLKKLEFGDGAGRRSRSSSISSVNSNGSNSSAGLMRRTSLTSPSKPGTTAQGRLSSPRARASANVASDKTANGTANDTIGSPSGPKRVASPTQTTTANSSPRPAGSDAKATSGAAAGAAAAIFRSGHSNNPAMKSPLRNLQNSQESTSSGTEQSGSSSNSNSDPGASPSRITKKIMALEEEQVDDVPPLNSKLTAAQRFQQHVRSAAKSGTLVTQQRETLTTVTYDPNNTSKLQIRRYVDQPTNSPTSSPPPEQEFTQTPKRRTRDQVTRQNTQRNSYIPDFPDDGSTSTSTTVSTDATTSTNNTTSEGQIQHEQDSTLSKSTTPEVEDAITVSDVKTSDDNDDFKDENNHTTTVIIKKVRFVGVPDWTEAEDAPTNYGNTILKNFAYFRNQTRTMRAANNNKSDQFLKEESMTLRAHQHVDEGNGHAPGEGLAARIAPKPKSGLARFKSKLI